MAIVFFCQSCGSRFEVGAGMAGKRGHCRSCGQTMVIPAASEIASMVAMPAIAAGVSAKEGQTAGSGPGWIDRSLSKIALAPLTAEGMRKVFVPKPSPLDDATNSALYNVVDDPDHPAARRESSPVGRALAARGRGLGGIQKLARWINQSAYLLSVPFIIITLAGIALKNRPLALFGATVVVLLNLSRIVSGVFNVAVIPFRENLIQGVFFLFPPYTLFYTANNWKKMRKPVQRVITPFLTIGLVFLAFTFVPWLTRDGKPSTGNPRETLRSGFSTLREDITSQLAQVQNLDLKRIEAAGGVELDNLKARLTQTISSARTAQGQPKYVPKSNGSGAANPTGSVSDLVNELQRLQSEINGLTR